jgi:hypothetical protein
MEVYNNPARYSPERVGVEFARHASWFAISGVGAMVVFLCAPLVVPEQCRGGSGAHGAHGALGVGFYAVCALMIVVSRQANRIGVSAARPAEEPGSPELDEVAVTTVPAAPSTVPADEVIG